MQVENSVNLDQSLLDKERLEKQAKKTLLVVITHELGHYLIDQALLGPHLGTLRIEYETGVERDDIKAEKSYMAKPLGCRWLAKFPKEQILDKRTSRLIAAGGFAAEKLMGIAVRDPDLTSSRDAAEFRRMFRKKQVEEYIEIDTKLLEPQKEEIERLREKIVSILLSRGPGKYEFSESQLRELRQLEKASTSSSV